MTRIFSDRALLPEGANHVTMLCPFWGREPGLLAWPDYTDELIAHGREFLQLTELANAELAVYPVEIRAMVAADRGKLRLTQSGRAQLESFTAAALGAGAQPVFFLRTDYVQPLELVGAHVFRTALHRAVRARDEWALPGFHEDLLTYCGGSVHARAKAGKPTVGFCGGLVSERDTGGPIERGLRRAGRAKWAVLAAFGRPDERDLYARARALDALATENEVETRIIVRDAAGGGAWSTSFDRELWERVRREYVDVALASDYVLCVRGAGNWSYRLSETLSLGRIPVFVDTQCVLPYDFLVDWRDCMVWVDVRDVDRIGEQVAEFHERLSDGEFVELQHACRRLWEEYLSPLGYFKNFRRHFELGRDGRAER